MLQLLGIVKVASVSAVSFILIVWGVSRQTATLAYCLCLAPARKLSSPPPRHRRHRPSRSAPRMTGDRTLCRPASGPGPQVQLVSMQQAIKPECRAGRVHSPSARTTSDPARSPRVDGGVVASEHADVAAELHGLRSGVSSAGESLCLFHTKNA